jgi:hypothetical protein
LCALAQAIEGSFFFAGQSADAERFIGMGTTESQYSELIPLKRAAYDLGLTPEGLRLRLIRIGQGIRRNGRWYIEAARVEEMRNAAVVLGGIVRTKKEPRPSHDQIAAQAGQIVVASDDVAGIAISPTRGNHSKTSRLAP